MTVALSSKIISLKMTIADLTKEQLQEYVKDSTNWKELMIKCGYKNINTRNNLKRKLETCNISIDHFDYNSKSYKRYNNEEIFIKDSKYASSYGLKDRLVKYYKWEYTCSSCKLSEWLGGAIPIELDHINGDHHDNRIENLRFLCPNCHSLTDTYRGKNVKFSEEIHNKKKCPECGNTKKGTSAKCIDCVNKIVEKNRIENLNNPNPYSNFSEKKMCKDCNIKMVQNDCDRCMTCYKNAIKLGQYEKEKKESKSTKPCPDCNKIISRKSVRCRLCNYELLKEKSNTYGKIQEKGKCLDCTTNIDIKAIRCLPCSNKIVEEANSKLSKKCLDCKKDIWSTSLRCTDCHLINSRKVERPSYEQLLEDKKEMNLVQIGKKYGVSDNCVRKWIKRYELLKIHTHESK